MRSRERRIDGKWSGRGKGKRSGGGGGFEWGFSSAVHVVRARRCALIVTPHLSGQILVRLAMGPSMSAKMTGTYLMTSLVS